MRVYFDNCIVSGEIRGDLAPASEQSAMVELRQRERAGQISILTSVESVREQERTMDPDTKKTELMLQIGGKATVGRGQVRCVFT